MAHDDSISGTRQSASCTHVWELSHDADKRIGYRCARCAIFTRVDDVRAFQSSLLPEIGEDELLAFLDDIASGRVELQIENQMTQSYRGNVEYRASNGWRVVVFSEDGAWDYFNRIESNDGRLVTFTTVPENVHSYCERVRSPYLVTRYNA